jgi:hypothetical protein
MPDRRAILALLLAAVASSGAVVAAPKKSSPVGSGSRSAAPAEFVSQIDGPMATAAGIGGRTWAAWAYRAAGEFDVAVSSRDAAGLWSPPTYVGRRDGIDEVEPSVAVDALGTVYVAFTTRGTGRVSVSALVVGASTWLGPVIVSGNEHATSPAIRIFDNHVVVAYRTAAGTGIAELPVLPAFVIMGIQDGPDGVDPLGMIPRWSGGTKQKENDSDEPPPSTE